MDDVLESMYATIISNRQNILKKVWAGLLIQYSVSHTINISKYNPLVGSSYVKLPKELDIQ